MAKRPQLMIVGGSENNRRFEVKPGGVRLGRSSSNDIHVPDEELSRNHCFFEPVGESGIRLTDLASANGTFVNGKALGSDPVDVKEGDVISVGTTVLKVVGEKMVELPTSVDLGLGSSPTDAPSPAVAVGKPTQSKRSRTPLLIGALAVMASVAVAVMMLDPNAKDEKVVPLEVAKESGNALRELYYEKVSANTDGIFRYELKLSADRVLSVSVDDVPAQNRHLTKSQTLDDEAMKELSTIVGVDRFRELDREYEGVMPDPPALESWTLRTVYESQTRSVKIANVAEPEAFRAMREKIEAFSKNQLGVWALQYSREKLISLAEDAIRLAKTKWEDRDVRYGNLHEAVATYKEAIFYLETVNPKPDCIKEATEGLKTAGEELEKRYKDQRFLADRAINLAQWDVAQRELQTLIEMVPDRADARNREASAKLVDVEKRLKGDRK